MAGDSIIQDWKKGQALGISGYSDPWSVVQRKPGSAPNKTPTAEELALLGYDPEVNAASRAMHEKELFKGRVMGERELLPAFMRAATERSDYALDPRDPALMNAGQANPFIAHLQQRIQADPNAFRGVNAALGQAQAAAGGINQADVMRGDARAQIGQYGQDIGLLRASAMGQGPSAAQAMMRSSLDANARGAHALAAGARGGNMAAGLRSAIGAGNAANLQGIQQMAALRANEQLTAQGQLANAQQGLAGAYNAARGMDVNRAGMQAGALAASAGLAGQMAGQRADYGLATQRAATERMGVGSQAYGQGVQNMLQGRTVSAGIAAQAAADREEQRRRALHAYGQLGGLNESYLNRVAGLYTADQANQFQPKDIIGGLTSLAGAAGAIAGG